MKIHVMEDLNKLEEEKKTVRKMEALFVDTVFMTDMSHIIEFGQSVDVVYPNIKEVIDFVRPRIGYEFFDTVKKYIMAFDSYNFAKQSKESYYLNINRAKWQKEIDKDEEIMKECAEILEKDLSPYRWHILKHDANRNKLYMIELVKEDDYV